MFSEVFRGLYTNWILVSVIVVMINNYMTVLILELSSEVMVLTD